MKIYKLTASAVLVAISAVFQVAHLGWLSPWGMWIDLVAIPWILAFFLYGGRWAFLVSAGGAIMITFLAPSTWLGASMKWLATMPMWLVPFLWQKTGKFKPENFKKMKIIIPATIVAIFIRGLIVIPTNYFYAIPIWTGMTPEKAMIVIPWWIIFSLNAIQAVLEVTIAWLLFFMFDIKRFAEWE